MDISPRKPCKRMPEPVDEWLHAEGYFRKHAARDPTCLFRAVSEQVYLTQHFHLRVRRECVEFMRDNKDLFEESISIPFESYLEQMAYFTEWGGTLEIKAMSMLYRRDVVMFHGHKLTRQMATNNGYEKIIYLCHIPPKHYETVYERDFIHTAAIVYQTLYKDVFQMADVDNTVFKMLRDRSSNVSHEKFFLKENLEIRDQLTVELFNKLDNNEEEIEETQNPAKSFTPFPYRIAKALDPDIYRNTDLDVWHEIRKEVKNAGWTRYNGSDLQVGGKCLVQMDTKEDELDNANNNFSRPVNDVEKPVKDDNGNESKGPKKIGKKDPLIYSGHIQEMSKNEGPVVVFIEELGEKKTVPYSSLKPITTKKNKQTNWPVINQKKNTIFDSGNQKWKKSNWYGSSRKIKDLAINLNSLTTNEIDKNNNKIHSQETSQWDDESRHSDESSLSYKTYAMETLTAYQGYSVDTSIDVMPVSVVLENPHPNVVDMLQYEAPKPEENNSQNSANTEEKVKPTNDTPDKQISATCASNTLTEMVPDVSQNCNRNTQNEIYYPPQTGVTQYLGGNGGVYYPAADCNVVPSTQFFVSNTASYPPTSMESLPPGNQANQVLQSVNTSAPKSVEANCSDLPLSDLATLRYFYNLGVEYYRANCSWMACGAGQTMSFGTCYIPQSNSAHNQYNSPAPNNQPAHEVLTMTEEVSQISQNLHQKLTISQQPQGEQITTNREFSPHNGKGQGGRNMNPNNQGVQKPLNRNDSESRPLPHPGLAQQSPSYSPNNEKIKEPPNSAKDNQRLNRNSLAPRFKKNFDGRYRNSRQQQQQQQQQQQHHPHQQQQQNPHNSCNAEMQATKNVGAQNLHGSEHQQPAPVHSVAVNATNNSLYQNPVSQVPFSQPPMYAAVPYYPSDSETAFQNQYYPSNQSFPLSYIPHSDITDGNNVSHYPSNIYPGGDNYGQPYPLYPQYMYPPGVYPAMNAQNNPENWYAMPGPQTTMPVPHYVQYSATPTSMPSSPNPPHSSNVSK